MSVAIDADAVIATFIAVLDECGYESGKRVNICGRWVQTYVHKPCGFSGHWFSHPNAHDEICRMRGGARPMTDDERALVKSVINAGFGIF